MYHCVYRGVRCIRGVPGFEVYRGFNILIYKMIISVPIGWGVTIEIELRYKYYH